MSVGLFLFFGCLAGLIIFGPVMWLSRGSDRDRDVRRELRTALKREALAARALRRIANGTGGPELEAQIALDQLTNMYDETKELS